MTTEILEDKALKYHLEISSSTAEVGIYRTLLAERVVEEENALGEAPVGDLKKISRRILHTILFPAMIACVTAQSGFESWPPSFDEFCKIPEHFEMEWEEKTFRLNPHWKPQIPSEAQMEAYRKKVTSSTPVSETT